MSDAPLFDKHDITHIRGVDHPESIGIGPGGEAYTTGTGCQVYRLNLEDNVGEQFASTEARCLGTAVDADGNLYAAHTAGDVLKITPAGEVSGIDLLPGVTFLASGTVPLTTVGVTPCSDAQDP